MNAHSTLATTSSYHTYSSHHRTSENEMVVYKVHKVWSHAFLMKQNFQVLDAIHFHLACAPAEESKHHWSDLQMCGNQAARLNSPASSAHTAPRQTYAAPWHVQRGQTVAKAWYAEPAFWWAYPWPAATLVRTRLQEEEMRKEKTGQKKRSHIKTESKEINWKRKSWVFVLLHCCVQQSVQNQQPDWPACCWHYK